MINLNGDTTSGNYGNEIIQGNAAGSANASANTNATSFWPIGNTKSTTSWGTSITVDINGYANTTFFKSYTSRDAFTNNGASVSQMIQNIYSGVWTNTSAITSLKLTTSSSNNIVVGSQCSLYGIQ